ncbi:MAG: YcxB family protein, partial [Planctomycetota bacterium]
MLANDKPDDVPKGAFDIEFDLTADDIAAFKLNAARTSPTLRRRFLLKRYLPPLLLVAAGWAAALVAGLEGWPAYLVPVSSSLAVVHALAYPWMYRYAARRSAAARLALPERRRVSADGPIVSGSDSGETTLEWSDVERVEATDDHLFLYHGPDKAIVMPRRA